MNLIFETTANGTSAVRRTVGNVWTAQVVLSGTGAVSATVKVQGSNMTNVKWEDVVTYTMTGTTLVSDVDTFESAFAYVQIVVSNLTGTGSKVSASVSIQ